MKYKDRELLQYFKEAIVKTPTDPGLVGVEILTNAGEEATRELIKRMKDPNSRLNLFLRRTGDGYHSRGHKAMFKLESDDVRGMGYQIEAAINKKLGISEY